MSDQKEEIVENFAKASGKIEGTLVTHPGTGNMGMSGVPSLVLKGRCGDWLVES